MLIIPAIDIKAGRTVMLSQGLFSKAQSYKIEPAAAAVEWQNQGASLLHIVDLDGAQSGQFKNWAMISRIIKTAAIPIQLGGGIRSEQTISRLFKLGINRVILGSVIFENKDLFFGMLKKYGRRIIVSLDAKGGQLMKNGWQKKATMKLTDMAQFLKRKEVNEVIYTDIARDGMLSEPNYRTIAELKEILGKSLIVSGGIAALTDIRKLKQLEVRAVIVGKALYEKKFTFKEAAEC